MVAEKEAILYGYDVLDIVPLSLLLPLSLLEQMDTVYSFYLVAFYFDCHFEVDNCCYMYTVYVVALKGSAR